MKGWTGNREGVLMERRKCFFLVVIGYFKKGVLIEECRSGRVKDKGQRGGRVQKKGRQTREMSLEEDEGRGGWRMRAAKGVGCLS